MQSTQALILQVHLEQRFTIFFLIVYSLLDLPAVPVPLPACFKF